VDRTFITALLAEAFDRKSWHGTNLRGSLRNVTAKEAIKRPSRERHNIWELTLHCAYWKYTIRRRLSGEKRGSFARKGSNWFQIDDTSDTSDKAWRADVALLTAEHRSLMDAIGAASDQKISGMASLIRGIAAHDLYHAGQIQLLKRLVRSS
jgi:hypothetical protein